MEKRQAKITPLVKSVLLCGCFAAAAFAQQASTQITGAGPQAVPTAPPPVGLIPRSHQERESEYQAEHRIILNVVVTDGSGRRVAGLSGADFTVTDEGQPRKLTGFREVTGTRADGAAHVILMLDTINNTPRNIHYESKEIERFLAQGNGNLAYPAQIAVLSASGARVGPPSKDRGLLINQLHMLTRNVGMFTCPAEVAGSSQDRALAISIAGGSMANAIAIDSPPTHQAGCLNYRFQKSLTALNTIAMQQTDTPGRAILVWLGPGWPLLRDPDFREDTPAIKQNFFDFLVELSSAIREGQVTLDAVASPDLFRADEAPSDHDVRLMDGVPSEDQVTAGSLGLTVLAHQSGGQILRGTKDLATDIATCMADADTYYVLSFDSSPAMRPGELHSLRVTLDKPGLSIRTNTSYYAPQ